MMYEDVDEEEDGEVVEDDVGVGDRGSRPYEVGSLNPFVVGNGW